MAPIPQMDHYDVLGVARNASTAEIRASYLRLVKIYHPDRAPAAKAAAALQLFQAITAAYATLARPEARKAYDRELKTGIAPIADNDNRNQQGVWDHIREFFLER